MTEQIRDILNRVASGELSPEQAQSLLAEATRAEAAATQEAPAPPTAAPAPTSAADTPVPPPPAPEPVAKVSIRASAVRLVILADPTVDTAVADGPHRVSHVGETLTIHSDLSAGEYQTETPKSAFASLLSTVNRAGSTLQVRVNPSLPLEVLNVAGSLELTGVRAPASVGVEAGSARLRDGSGPLALSVASGSADVEWQFHGECAVSTDLGSARVSVLPGSDVAITADATLGMATIRMADGTTVRASRETHENPPVVVGAGSGALAVTSRLGSLVVSVM